MRKNPKRETNMKNKISAVLLATAVALAAGSGAFAQDKTVKVGVLTDNSGLYSDLGGAGSTLAAQMAIEDSGLAAKGWKIDLISADHQNKPDIATNIARQWVDVEKVDIFMDVLNSGVALAVNNLVKEKNSIMINTGAASSDLTNAQCSPNTIHWVYDTYMLANSTGQALVKAGGDTWYFLTADYAFGAALERDTTAVVVKSGGKVLGTVKHPRSCCRRRRRRRRSSDLRTQAAIPPTRSSRPRNSASSREARNLRACCCSLPMFTHLV
jgi:branched-chain amino acid transport system substrate-binding protein